MSNLHSPEQIDPKRRSCWEVDVRKMKMKRRGEERRGEERRGENRNK
jgi:hypothetical protein